MITVNENSVLIDDENVKITLAKGDYIVLEDGSDVSQVLGRTGGKITTVSAEDAETLKTALA